MKTCVLKNPITRTDLREAITATGVELERDIYGRKYK